MRQGATIFDQLFVYNPHPWIEQDWARLSGLPLEEVWFYAADGTRLFGWYVPASPGAPVLLWCHGNAGNIAHRLGHLAALARLDVTVFLFDYRGYGRSSGKPSEDGLYQDALAAHAYLTTVRGVRPERLVLFGRSLGAAVAADLASRKPAAGLILEAAFPSLAAVVRVHAWGLPLHWLFSGRFPLHERLARVRMPVLVLHGDRDTIVPLALGRAVFEAAQPPKWFFVIAGADHNTTAQVGGQAYVGRLRQFIDHVVR
jgi:pimeloyl-ACP methyl ester carboxylesterase